jgi:hypothetical protein
MITIGYCTRTHNQDHINHLIKSCGLGNKNIQIIEIINNGDKSLTECYNQIINESVNDLIVFTHDDIIINSKQFGHKLLKLFSNNPQYGIIGIAGSTYMPESGRWWENKKRMYGRVSHSNEGKTWLSAYSPSLESDIIETVVVDGVFFAIDKTKIKKTFNEEFKGFHFYDVSFCFENYLAGVKVGVTTIIDLTHKSIGMTNDQWESNRVQFVDTFKSNLPVKLEKVITKNEYIHLLITSISFNDDSVKSNAIFSLINKLVELKNVRVTLCSNLTGNRPNVISKLGVKLAPIQQPPGFILGDGKWVLKTPNGDVQSQPNVLYKNKDINFDIIHIFDDELIDHMAKVYPETSIVTSVFPNSLVLTETIVNPNTKDVIEMTTKENGEFDIDVNNIIQRYIKLM